MCPQLSLQVMMGVGTPTAWQVKVTVEPRADWMDSSGGLVTKGGAARRVQKIFTAQQMYKNVIMWLEIGNQTELRNSKQSEEA